MSKSSQPAKAPDRNEPHVFEEVDLLSGSLPLTPRWPGAGYAPPPTPAGKSRVCGVCGKGRDDRLHIEGKAEADAESPRWG